MRTPESVWDYPRPPRLEPVADRVRIVLGGVEIASSDQALRILETSHPPVYYIPPDHIGDDVLSPAPGSSFCEWKGVASYLDVDAGGRHAPASAWCYPGPAPQYRRLTDHVAFYCAAMDECWVGEERATPQPGGFYGGWVTSWVLGPFKGGPGTQGW